MMAIPWLTILALLPAAGAVLLIFIGVKAARQVALLISLITFVFALIIAAQFKIGGGMQMVEQVPWIKPLGAYYALGLDGLGLTLVREAAELHGGGITLEPAAGGGTMARLTLPLA